MYSDNNVMVVALQCIGVVAGMVGSILNAKRHIAGFYFWLGSNMALVALNAIVGLYGMVLLFVTYGAICVFGIRSWRQLGRAEAREMAARDGGR